MKTSSVCPKCAGRKLYVVDQVTQPHHESSNSTLPLWLMAARVARDDTGTPEGTRYRSHACRLEAWVCATCGLTEWYGKDTNELELLARHRDGGVRIVESKGEGE